jgi:signal transduction histidine kinase
MNALDVLVLEQDAQARTLAARLDSAEFVMRADGQTCDVAFCALEHLDAAFAAAGDAPVVALCTSDFATQACERGAAETLSPLEAAGSPLERTLRHAVKLAHARAALAASLDELEQQRSALLALSALKSDLIATLAHDIKGPLTSIVGFAELMEEGFLEGADATDAARTIRTNAQRLAALANDILALSRVESGELEIADDRVNLREVVDSAIAEAASERTIEAAGFPATAFVRGDAGRLRQVFENLLRNAIKYSPGGEPIRVEIEAGENGGYAVRVIDRGIGIPADERSKLFVRFGRASNARKSKIAGTGVGLFIVKTIVERHGGTVGAESAIGKGSTFTVTLPGLDAATELARGRVAIVSGDAQLRRFTAYELRTRGFRVREHEDLARAAADVRAGDALLIDAAQEDASTARAALGDGYYLVGIGAGEADGFDATLAKPFLISDLTALLCAQKLARQ